MDKIERRRRAGGFSRSAACMKICTRAVFCNERGNTQEYLMRRFRPIMEAVICVCDDVLVDHEWVSELTISVQETEVLVALNYDNEVPCVVQWRMLWVFRPQRLDKIFQTTALHFAKYNEAIDMAILRLRPLCPSVGRTRRECAC